MAGVREVEQGAGLYEETDGCAEKGAGGGAASDRGDTGVTDSHGGPVTNSSRKATHSCALQIGWLISLAAARATVA